MKLLFDALNTLILIFILVVPTLYLFLLLKEIFPTFKKRPLVIFYYLVITLIFFNKLFFKGQALAQNDFNDIQIPLALFFKNSIRSFKLPIWNPFFGGGFDAFSNPLSNYFSSLNWIFLLGKNIYASYNIYLYLQLVLCLVFAHFMLKVYKFSDFAAIVGATIFTFNAFVTMRLSPGVGVEYLFVYKWIPVVLAFTEKFFAAPSKKAFALMVLALSFAFEGNTNVTIAIYLMWGFVLLLNFARYKKIHYVLFTALIYSALLQAIRILPAYDLSKSFSSRISKPVSGWRAARLSFGDFIKYFLPIKGPFGEPNFSPGVFATLICFLGLVFLLVQIGKKRKDVQLVGIYLLGIGSLLVTKNPLSNLFFSLPLLNRLTVTPTFVTYILIGLVFLAADGMTFIERTLSRFVENILKRYAKNFRAILVLPILTILISFGVFLEVMIGPSTFGVDTYSYNFAKMDYKTEPQDFAAYKKLGEYEKGMVAFLEPYKLLMFSYGTTLNDIFSLNGTPYFFGSRKRQEPYDDTDYNFLTSYADYVVSPFDVEDSRFELLSTVEHGDIISKHKSHSVFNQRPSYRHLTENLGWDGNVRIYKVNAVGVSAYKSLLVDSTKVVIQPSEQNYVNGSDLVTSISYSKWWRSLDNDVTIEKDEFGFLRLSGLGVNEQTTLIYANFYIYLGFILSLIVALCFFAFCFDDEKKLGYILQGYFTVPRIENNP